MSPAERIVVTSHAEIAIAETSGEGLPVLLLHGNSSCKEAFRRQLDSSLGEAHRLIAMDLPGHGASSDAFDPARTYSIPGYAATATEVLTALGIRRAVVVGWSLGGHAALEMLPRFPGIAGLVLSGAPPVGQSPEAIALGFKPNPHVMLAGKEDFTAEDIENFARVTTGGASDPALKTAIRRTDGRARRLMFESLFAGAAADERQLAENTSVLLAIINGAEDPLINLDYLDTLSCRNQWEGRCHRLAGVGHAPFLEAPEAFNAMIERFLASVAAKTRKGAREPLLKLAG